MRKRSEFSRFVEDVWGIPHAWQVLVAVVLVGAVVAGLL